MNKSIYKTAITAVSTFALCLTVSFPAMAEGNDMEIAEKSGTQPTSAPVVRETTTITKTNLDGLSKKFNKNSVIELTGVVSGGSRKVEIKKYDATTKKWNVEKTLMTDSQGYFKYSTVLTSNSSYILSVPAHNNYKAITSKITSFIAVVAPSTIVNTTLDGKVKTYARGTSVELKGTVNGGVRSVNILKYNRSTNEWDIVQSLKTDSKGVFKHRITVNSTEHYSAQAVRNDSYGETFTPSTTIQLQAVDTSFTVGVLNGQKHFFSKNSKVNVSGTVSGANRTVQIIKYNTSTGKWDVIHSGKSDSKGKYSIPVIVKSSGKYAVIFPFIDGYKATVGYSTEITVSNTKPSTSPIIKFAKTVPWQNNNISGKISGVPVNVYSTVSLQQKSGSTWKNVSKTTVKGNSNYNFSLYKGNTKSKDATQYYRIVISGSGITTTTINNLNVVWDNPLIGSAQARNAYNYVKAYCPDSAIVVKQLPNNLWGTAELGKNIINISPKVPSKHLRSVALHECAHHRQYSLYSRDWTGFKNRMNKIYGRKGDLGMENNTECIANYWYKNSYWGYSVQCTGEKQTVAVKIAKNQRPF